MLFHIKGYFLSLKCKGCFSEISLNDSVGSQDGGKCTAFSIKEPVGSWWSHYWWRRNYGSLYVRNSCWFKICYLNVSLASSFWDLSVSLFKWIGWSSCMLEIAAWRRCKYCRWVNWLLLKRYFGQYLLKSDAWVIHVWAICVESLPLRFCLRRHLLM